jgi:hypothetical protein
MVPGAWECELAEVSWDFATNILNRLVVGTIQPGLWRRLITQLMAIFEERFLQGFKGLLLFCHSSEASGFGAAVY